MTYKRLELPSTDKNPEPHKFVEIENDGWLEVAEWPSDEAVEEYRRERRDPKTTRFALLIAGRHIRGAIAKAEGREAN